MKAFLHERFSQAACHAALGLVVGMSAGVFTACAQSATPTSPSSNIPNDVPVSIEISDGDLAKQIDAIVREASKTGFGGTVVIVDHDKVVLKAGYGWANREAQTPFKAETIHQIGSITKVFTALAVFDLVERGLVDLDQPVGRYLPTAAQPMASATLAQILRHRSGMIEYCGADHRTVTKDALLTRCMGARLEAKRDAEYHYSNPAFSVLAAVVEQVSGEPLHRYIERRITGPLDMAHTTYGRSGITNDEVARTYVKDKSKDPFDASAADGKHWQVYGNGGMVSTAEDMVRFYRALSTEGPMSTPIRSMALTTPSGSTPGKVEFFGFGLVPDEAGKTRVVALSGSNGYFLSSFYWRPQGKLMIYIHGNNGEDEVLPLVRRVRSAVDAEARSREEMG